MPSSRMHLSRTTGVCHSKRCLKFGPSKDMNIDILRKKSKAANGTRPSTR